MIREGISLKRCMFYDQFDREYMHRNMMLHLQQFSLAGAVARLLTMELFPYSNAQFHSQFGQNVRPKSTLFAGV